jgi:hypothetical protein
METYGNLAPTGVRAPIRPAPSVVRPLIIQFASVIPVNVSYGNHSCLLRVIRNPCCSGWKEDEFVMLKLDGYA